MVVSQSLKQLRGIAFWMLLASGWPGVAAADLIPAVPGMPGAEFARSPEPRPEATGYASATSTHLITFQLNEGETVAPNTFDLAGRTLRFSPVAEGYEVVPVDFVWEPDPGTAFVGSTYAAASFQFPFAGQSWSSFHINPLGSITFGQDDNLLLADTRFSELRTLGSRFEGVVPAIAALIKPRMSGSRFVREDADSLLVTWELYEPAGGIFDYVENAAVNQVQARLHANGVVELSYQSVAVADGIVGVFPTYAEVPAGDLLASLEDTSDAAVAAHLDMQRVEIREIPGRGLELTFVLRGDIPAERSGDINNVWYRLHVDVDEPLISGVDFEDPDYVWSLTSNSSNEYVLNGAGVFGEPEVDGNIVRIRAAVPGLEAGGTVAVFADSVNFNNFDLGFDQTAVATVTLPGVTSAARDLSAGPATSPYPYEIFHHRGLPDEVAVACDVVTDIGDAFDFIVYYSQFRTDQQEAGSPVNIVKNDVQGIGSALWDNSAGYFSDGQLQAVLVQPLFIDALQGTDAGPSGLEGGFNYAMSQVGHELAHRWLANAAARVDGQDRELGDGVHWLPSVHAPVAHPYLETAQASAMGGGHWRDNGDGTFTRQADNFFVPASGFSWLDLYLMGFVAAGEVPDFFLLDDLLPGGSDSEGPVYTGTRRAVTIEDVIAVEGVRSPASDESQRTFNVAFVYLTADGETAAPDRLARLADLRDTFISYWSHITGGRSTMTTIVPGAAPLDSDGDGIPDDADPDDDNDGYLDTDDYFPLLADEVMDTDLDGIGNRADDDDDGDGIADTVDAWPLDASAFDGTPRLENISTRGPVGTGDEVMIGGVIIEGSAWRNVLIRARGPSLADAGVPGTLADPFLQLFTNGELVRQNDSWEDDVRGVEIPLALRPTRPLEAALVAYLPPGGHTAIVSGAGGATGIGIVEIFDLDADPATRLGNISTRGLVETADNVMIGGVIVGGHGERRVTFRARGPSIADADASLAARVLMDPWVQVFDSDGNLIAEGDNWMDHSSVGLIPAQLRPTNPAESAFTLDLAPGGYTAIVRGNGGTAGVAIVEAFVTD